MANPEAISIRNRDMSNGPFPAQQLIGPGGDRLADAIRVFLGPPLTTVDLAPGKEALRSEQGTVLVRHKLGDHFGPNEYQFPYVQVQEDGFGTNVTDAAVGFTEETGEKGTQNVVTFALPPHGDKVELFDGAVIKTNGDVVSVVTFEDVPGTHPIVTDEVVRVAAAAAEMSPNIDHELVGYPELFQISPLGTPQPKLD